MSATLASPTTEMPTGIRNASIVFNPLAGGGHAARPQQIGEARAILAKAGIETDVRPTSVPGEAGQVAARAIEDGAEMIVVCGGDGTLNEVVNGIAGSQVPVALLPAGTANILAKELGIPWNIPEAAALIPKSHTARIALGLMTQPEQPESRRYFLCVAGAGADGALVHALDVGVKLKAGILAYWLEGGRQLLRYKFPQFRVSAAGQEVLATLIVVGRTRNYGGPFCITPGANLFADQFEIATFSSRRALRSLAYLPACWMHMLPKLKDVRVVRTASLRCEPVDNGPIYAQVDGEPDRQLPMDFTIVPDALTLVVPEHVRLPLPA
jgi:diacylglycerol kinase (ATP)